MYADRPLRRLLGAACLGLHAVLLAGAAAVPVYISVHAVREIAAADDRRITWLAWQRWADLGWNSALVCGVAALTAVPAGSLLALLIARTDLPGRRILAAAAALALCIPAYVSLTFALAAIPAWRIADSLFACGAIYGLLQLPVVTLFMCMVFSRPAVELEDDARLHAGRWTVFTRVTVPSAGWGVAVATLMVLLLVLSDYSVADLLTIRTFAEEVYSQFALDRGSAAPAVAGLPVLILLTAIFMFAAYRMDARPDAPPHASRRSARRIELGRWRWPLSLSLLALGAAPLLFVASLLGRQIGSATRFFDAARTAIGDVGRSALLSAIAATLIVAVAAGLAWSLVRFRRARLFLLATLALLLATPAPVAGVGLITIFNRSGWMGDLYDSAFIIVFGFVVRFLPLGVWLLVPAARRISRELEDAARVDGADWTSVLRHLLWPEALPDAAVAWLLLAVQCFGEIGCTMLVAPPAWPTASFRAFSLLHFGVYADLAVLAILSAAAVIIPWALLLVLVQPQKRQEEP